MSAITYKTIGLVSSIEVAQEIKEAYLEDNKGVNPNTVIFRSCLVEKSFRKDLNVSSKLALKAINGSYYEEKIRVVVKPEFKSKYPQVKTNADKNVKVDTSNMNEQAAGVEEAVDSLLSLSQKTHN